MHALRVAVERSAVDTAAVDAAIRGIEARPGVCIGTDGGIAGLHPLGATLVVEPSLRFGLHARSLSVEPLDAFGAALADAPALDAFRRLAREGSPIDALRAFLAAFPPLPEVRLVGAWRFESHRLQGAAAPGGDDPDELGFLFFARVFHARDAAGAWHRIALAIDGVGIDADATAARAPAPMAHASRHDRAPVDDFAPGAYAGVVARGIARLAGADLVSLTLSQRFRRAAPDASSADAFERLRRVNPAPVTFAFHDRGERVFGASPDLQLVVTGRDVLSLPVCGTVGRGEGAVGEAEALRALFASDVDAASLAVCSDALQNDLAPLCEPGSLRLTDRRRPMSLATVVHAVDALRGRLRNGVDAWDAIVATTAPPMLVGTPRRAALAAIAALEASPRGWYGGLLVEVRADGDARVGTLLRAASLLGGVAEVSAGGDLLADSDPAHEAEESRIKSLSLWRALGLADRAEAVASDAERVPVDAPASVALVADGDAFAAALVATLESLGIGLDAASTVSVVSGAAAAGMHGVAVGDAAFATLRAHGVAVERVVPQQGRLAVGAVVDPRLRDALGTASVRVGVYARHRLVDHAPVGWTIWMRDGATGAPLALGHGATATSCLLFRPESTLGEAAARRSLGWAIAFAVHAVSSVRHETHGMISALPPSTPESTR